MDWHEKQLFAIKSNFIIKLTKPGKNLFGAYLCYLFKRSQMYLLKLSIKEYSEININVKWY